MTLKKIKTGEAFLWRKSLILLFTFAFLMGCKKEDVYSEDVFGTWSIEEIRCIGNYKDSLITGSGRFQFLASQEIGKSGYGTFMKAEGMIPEWKNTGVVLLPETLYFSAPIEKRTYNYRNSFHGVFARQVLGGPYETLPVDMYRHSSDGMYLFLANRNSLTSHRFQQFRLHLKRISK
jgi:hypothetical protein